MIGEDQIKKMQKIPVRHIAKIKEPDLSGNFVIRDIATLLSGKDMMQDLHRHDFFLILAIKKGKGKHVIDFTSYPITDHSIFFMRPGQVHQLDLKKNSTGYLMQFDPGFYLPKEISLSNVFRKVSNKNYCSLKAVPFDKLRSTLDYINEEFTTQKENYIDVVKAGLQIFFIELARQSQQPKKIIKPEENYSQSQLEIFLELLQTNIATKKQVADYAGMMHLSPYQLNSITKTTIGKTSSAIIDDHIILEAKRHLLATSNQVNQIADDLGFEDVSYFIRFFKRHTGQSPELFRKKFK